MNGEQLSKMILLATTRHSGQFDKGGSPYILHCLKVMHYLKTDDEELQCIALGHDLIEDTYSCLSEGVRMLSKEGFSDRIISGIVALTKIEGQTYDRYKELVKANHDAIRVKMADLRHNTDIRRLKGLRQKDFERIERYHRFYLELKDALIK
jgi:(p)ppGpp synthase/HD superfamily hydrolase